MRGRIGKVELRGQELIEAAEAHDALFSFDARARAAVARGRPARACRRARCLFVKLDPRGVIDVESSLRSVWPTVERCRRQAGVVGLELMGAERYRGPRPARGARRRAPRAGRRSSASTTSRPAREALRVLEALKPDVAKLSLHLCKGIETSPARRHLVGALVEVAHELGCRVVAVGIERDSELEPIQELGIDLGQGFFLGQPNEEMLPVDRGLVARASGHPSPSRG